MYFRMKYFPVSVAQHLMLGPEACQAECLSLTPVERWLLYHILLKLSTYPSQQMSLCPSQLCVAARWSWEIPRHDEICFFVRLCLFLSPCLPYSSDMQAALPTAWTEPQRLPEEVLGHTDEKLDQRATCSCQQSHLWGKFLHWGNLDFSRDLKLHHIHIC